MQTVQVQGPEQQQEQIKVMNHVSCHESHISIMSHLHHIATSDTA